MGWTGRVGKMAGVGVGMTGVTGFTAIAFVAEEPLLAVVVVLAWIHRLGRPVPSGPE